MLRELHRAQTSTALSTSDAQIAGPNPRRYALIIDAPPLNVSGQLAKGVTASTVDVSTTGIKLTYTVGAGVQGYLLSVSWTLTAGAAPTIALELKRGATTFKLILAVVQGVTSVPMSLLAGDKIQLDVTTGGVAGTADMTINASEDQLGGQVTVSFTGPAVLNNGHNLYPGGSPLILTHDHIGQAIREDIHAIAASGTPTITVTDVFEVDCPCLDSSREAPSPVQATGKVGNYGRQVK